jgi:hypothetical protein
LIAASGVCDEDSSHTFSVWSSEVGTLLWSGNHLKGGSSIAFTSSNDRLITGGAGANFCLWDLRKFIKG